MANKLPKAAVLFFILFLMTEYCIYKFVPDYITNPTEVKLQDKINIAKKAGFKNDILILGDSSAGAAINANMLQARTGLACFNFSLVGDALIVGDYFIFKDYLLANGDPKYIILMNVYDIWHRDIVNEALLSNFWSDIMKNFLNIVVLSDNYKLASTNIANAISQLLPSQIYRFEIKRSLESMPNINLSRRKKETYALEQKLLKDRGSAILLESDEGSVRKDSSEHEKFVDSNKFKVSKINQHYLDRLLREANLRKIKVFISFPPIFNEFYNNKERGQYLSLYKTFIKSLPRLYDNVVLLTDDFYVVPSQSLSLTIDHLNKDGSLVFTKMIAEKILEFISSEKTAKK